MEVAIVVAMGEAEEEEVGSEVDTEEEEDKVEDKEEDNNMEIIIMVGKEEVEEVHQRNAIFLTLQKDVQKDRVVHLCMSLNSTISKISQISQISKIKTISKINKISINNRDSLKINNGNNSSINRYNSKQILNSQTKGESNVNGELNVKTKTQHVNLFINRLILIKLVKKVEEILKTLVPNQIAATGPKGSVHE